MNKKNILYIAFVILLMGVLSGCQIGKDSDVNGTQEYDDKEWKDVYCELVDGWMDGTVDPYCDPETLQFDLVYINEDEMPELVVSGDEWLYLYTYCPGSVASNISDVNVLMEEWWWGTSSNTGYFYLPSQNVIQNSNSDPDRYTVEYFHMNDNLALAEWYQTWYDIEVAGEERIYTYFYNGPETLEENQAGEDVEDVTAETNNGDAAAGESEEAIPAVKMIEKQISEEEWIAYNYPDGGFLFLKGNLSASEVKEEIENCFVSAQGAPVFVGLQPIYYVPENDSVHRQNYYEMITLLEQKLPKQNVSSEETEGDVEIISIADGDIGKDGKKDVAVILQSYDPAVSGWTDYGRYDFTVCTFTEIDGAYQCTGINHNMISSDAEYYDPEKYLYSVNISNNGELEVSYTVKDGDDWETLNYFFELKGNSLILCRLETEYDSQASGCGKRIIQNIANGEVKGVAYSNLENAFEEYELYTGTFEPATMSFDKLTKWQIPMVDETMVTWNADAQKYNYKALFLENYLAVKEPAEGEEVEELESWKKAYLNLMQAIVLGQTEVHNKELTYRLIYINEDEIPELVVSQNGYFVSVFTYAPEGQYGDVKEVNVLLENCGYGAMGNVGYYYLPKDNIIYNYNADFAGAAGTTWYGYINEKNQLDSKYTIYYEDIDMQDDSEECKYYFNGKEISKDLYETYYIDGNFKFIEGNRKAYEIVEEIMKL